MKTQYNTFNQSVNRSSQIQIDQIGIKDNKIKQRINTYNKPTLNSDVKCGKLHIL